MMEFIKTFFKGFMIIILSPIWLILLCSSITIIIASHLLHECLLVINFFRGLNYISDDKYSKELEEAIANKEINRNILSNNNEQLPTNPQIYIINQGEAKLTPEQLKFISEKKNFTTLEEESTEVSINE